MKWYLRTRFKLILGYGVRKIYSHQGEDGPIQMMFKWKKNGVYVDVGAYDPVLYSNTYGLYRSGWHGLVIDPNESLRSRYALMRPRDTFVALAVGEREEEKTFYQFADGAYNTFDGERAREWERLRGMKIEKTAPVRFKPLSKILRESNIERIDFMNVDVEGLDLEVLKTHDWNMKPRVIAVEDERFDPDSPRQSEVYNFLHDKGYVLGGLTSYTLIFKEPSRGVFEKKPS